MMSIIMGLILIFGRAVNMARDATPLIIGGIGVILFVLADIIFISPLTSAGVTVLITVSYTHLTLPTILLV